MQQDMIAVKTFTGKEVQFRTDVGSTTVEDLKKNIFDKEGIPLDQQRLIFNGEQLQDFFLLSEYDVTQGATVHLVLRLRGGKLFSACKIP